MRCEQSQDTIAKPHLLLEQQDGQTIYKVVCGQQFQGILTAVVFGMAPAFGEALAIQMVIGIGIDAVSAW